MNTCCNPKIWLKFFRAVSDKHRQKVLTLLKKHHTLNASNIMTHIGLSQPTTSHHLSLLKQAGLITSIKKGKEVYYSLNKKMISSCCLGFNKELGNNVSI